MDSTHCRRRVGGVHGGGEIEEDAVGLASCGSESLGARSAADLVGGIFYACAGLWRRVCQKHA